VPREFREGFFKSAGEHMGKWVAGVLIAIVIAVVVSVLRLWIPLFNLLNGPKPR
jgi:hypothetical protein